MSKIASRFIVDIIETVDIVDIVEAIYNKLRLRRMDNGHWTQLTETGCVPRSSTDSSFNCWLELSDVKNIELKTNIFHLLSFFFKPQIFFINISSKY